MDNRKVVIDSPLHKVNSSCNGINNNNNKAAHGTEMSTMPVNHPLSDSSASIAEDGEDISSIYSDSSSKYTDSLPSPSAGLPSSRASRRQKFLHPPNDTVEKLRPEELRWFYRDESDKRWVPFIGYDSLRIETKFRELLAFGGAGGARNEHIIVRGGLFEVDVLERKCLPIYWTVSGQEPENTTLNQTSSVLRGSWFREQNWQPVDEDLADKMELEHLKEFEGLPVEDTPIVINDTGSVRSASPSSTASQEKKEGRKKIAIHTLRFSDCHVDWYSIDDVYLYQDSAALFIRQKLGMQKVGTKLRRGYCYNAVMDDKPPDVTHLCFVIHGIGQKMRTGAIIKSCADLRAVCNKIKERYFPDLDASNQRVEFLPVEWRSSLRLDGDTVDSITPTNMRGLRQLLNSSAMDILYYTSPLYRSEITHGLQTELNRLYSMYCSRHPYFEPSGGRVSIIAHSLGSVITYDIIMGWNPIQLYDQYVQSAIVEQSHDLRDCQKLLNELEEARKRVNNLELNLLSMAEKEHMKIPTLSFRLENFFCLGSPLAVFLALRGVRPKGTGTPEHFLPKNVCSKIFNIYHPADPVAYRLEPLILKAYASVQSMRIHKFDSLSKPPYSTIPRKPVLTGKKRFTVGQKNKEATAGGSSPDVREDDFSTIHSERMRRASGNTAPEPNAFDEEETMGEETSDSADGNTENVQPPTLSKRLSTWFTRIGNKDSLESQSTHSSPQTFRRNRSSRNESEMNNLTTAASCSELKDLSQYSRDGIEEELGNHPARTSDPNLKEQSCELEEALAALNRQCSAPPTVQSSGSGSVSSTTRLSSPAYSALDSYTGMLEQTDLEYRVDYQLQESRYESSYLSVLTSHTSYWNNQDVAMFVLSHLFPAYGPIGIPKAK